MIHGRHFIGFVLLAAIFVFVGLLATGTGPGEFASPYRSTTTITGVTESLRFDTTGQPLSWGLPPGQFAALGDSSHSSCRTLLTEDEVACELAANSRLLIESEAAVTIETDPTGSWIISVEAVEGNALTVFVEDSKGTEVLRGDQYLSFRAGTTSGDARFPLVANSATLGADLYEVNEILNTANDYWQPALRSGHVVIIASKGKQRTKYKVLDEQLDGGDVVHIGQGQSPDSYQDATNSVWGMVSVKQTANDVKIDAVLHTSLREILVTRFGAPEGHRIEASSWSIFSRWPAGQSVWVFFISVSVVVSFLMHGAEFFSMMFRRKGDRDN